MSNSHRHIVGYVAWPRFDWPRHERCAFTSVFNMYVHVQQLVVFAGSSAFWRSWGSRKIYVIRLMCCITATTTDSPLHHHHHVLSRCDVGSKRGAEFDKLTIGGACVYAIQFMGQVDRAVKSHGQANAT